MALKDKVKDTLKNKKLDDLKDHVQDTPESSLIDPTPAMIMEVVEALRSARTLRQIQLDIKVSETDKRILSMEQIKTIKRERLIKIAKLSTPELEPEPKAKEIETE